MRAPSSKTLIAAAVVGVVTGMVGLSYASVPLYRLFCAATGYAGTTQVAKEGAAARGERMLTVRFDTNVAAGLDWSFTPETDKVRVRTGETATVFFKVVNRSAAETTGVARYNVAPDAAGAYFDKIACFCFAEQTLAPGESMEMPVAFFLDPALEKDETMAGVDGVTLSYTFYSVKKSPVASAAPPASPKL